MIILVIGIWWEGGCALSCGSFSRGFDECVLRADDLRDFFEEGIVIVVQFVEESLLIDEEDEGVDGGLAEISAMRIQKDFDFTEHAAFL